MRLGVSCVYLYRSNNRPMVYLFTYGCNSIETYKICYILRSVLAVL